MQNVVITAYAAEKAGSDFKPAYAPLVREWKDFCHDSRYRRVAMMVDFNACRDRSRWTVERRARPFTVKFLNTLEIAGSSKTLEGALKIAARWADARAAAHRVI